jgi:hypothetical protein
LNVLTEVLERTQPGYEAAVGQALIRLLDALGEPAFEGVSFDHFLEEVGRLIGKGAAPAPLRLQLLSDLASLTWWCELECSDVVVGQLAGLARHALYEQSRPFNFRKPTPTAEALTTHAVLVGELVNILHSPTRGAFEYVRALAVDPDVRSIEVVHTGFLKPDLRSFATERLKGGGAEKVTFIEAGGDLLARLTDRPRTYHFWCESAYNPLISLLALSGPTVMFTCGDAAPIQYADVYWYCHEPSHIDDLWARKATPATFVANYEAARSAPFNRLSAQRARNRSDLGLREGECVLVTAGNRISVELDQAFVDGLGAILAANAGVRWVVVGDLPDFWIAAFRQVLGDQFTYIAFDEDLAGLFGLCDLFVNPFRVGGGNTAIMAIDAGAPVLTVGDLGDVRAFVPAGHRAAGPEAYFERLQELIQDPALRTEWLQAQRELLAARLDQAGFAAELKRFTSTAFGRFEGRSPSSLEQIYAQVEAKQARLTGS